MTGKNAGIDHNYLTSNRLQVKNTGNTRLVGISLQFGAFHNGTGDLWNATGNVTVLRIGDGPTNYLSIGNNNYLNYTVTGVGTDRAIISMLMFADFELEP